MLVAASAQLRLGSGVSGDADSLWLRSGVMGPSALRCCGTLVVVVVVVEVRRG